MARFQFVTTGRDYASDIDQIGHSTFMAEVEAVADVAPLKAAIAAGFGAIDVELDRHYAVSLTADADSCSFVVFAAHEVAASAADAAPEMPSQELERNLAQQDEDRRALEALVAEAKAAGVID